MAGGRQPDGATRESIERFLSQIPTESINGVLSQLAALGTEARRASERMDSLEADVRDAAELIDEAKARPTAAAAARTRQLSEGRDTLEE